MSRNRIALSDIIDVRQTSDKDRIDRARLRKAYARGELSDAQVFALENAGVRFDKVMPYTTTLDDLKHAIKTASTGKSWKNRQSMSMSWHADGVLSHGESLGKTIRWIEFQRSNKRLDAARRDELEKSLSSTAYDEFISRDDCGRVVMRRACVVSGDAVSQAITDLRDRLMGSVVVRNVSHIVDYAYCAELDFAGVRLCLIVSARADVREPLVIVDGRSVRLEMLLMRGRRYHARDVDDFVRDARRCESITASTPRWDATGHSEFDAFVKDVGRGLRGLSLVSHGVSKRRWR